MLFAWSIAAPIVVEKYVELHLALTVGVFIVTVGVLFVELENVAAVTAG